VDDIDRKILNRIQKDFPVAEEPFRLLGEELGIEEEELIGRIRKMKEEGLIRRIGAVFDGKKLGFVSTLCAARVPEEKIAQFVETVNALPGVTHNYRRSGEYNIWFTLIAPSEEKLRAEFDGIKAKTGLEDILDMRAVRTFKIDARFEV
jgi:DNA-binding Lrp family transcriptional regulator